MIWDIFIVLVVLKLLELITISWPIISLIGIVGFMFKLLWVAIKHLGEKVR